MPLTQDADIKRLLENTQTIAVVGYSDKSDRPSYGVAHALKNAGYDVVGVSPTVKSSTEMTVYPTLKDVPGKIDVVDVFRRADAVPEVVNEAIEVGAKAVWMQLGIVNEEAAKDAEAAGLEVVMDRCMKIDVSRFHAHAH